MKIIFHIGPHKTGTTTLQNFLLRQFGSEHPKKIWYPSPRGNGPGHALIAWDCLGLNGHQKSVSSLSNIIQNAGKQNTDVVVLSSEIFSLGIRKYHQEMNRLFAGNELHLILTLRNLLLMAPSIWQERVKHGFYTPLEDCVIDRFHPMFAAQFYENYYRFLQPYAMSIIISAPRDQ